MQLLVVATTMQPAHCTPCSLCLPPRLTSPAAACRQLNLLITLLNLLAIMYSRPAAAPSSGAPQGQPSSAPLPGQAGPSGSHTQPAQAPLSQPPDHLAPGPPLPAAHPPQQPSLPHEHQGGGQMHLTGG